MRIHDNSESLVRAMVLWEVYGTAKLVGKRVAFGQRLASLSGGVSHGLRVSFYPPSMGLNAELEVDLATDSHPIDTDSWGRGYIGGGTCGTAKPEDRLR